MNNGTAAGRNSHNGVAGKDRSAKQGGDKMGKAAANRKSGKAMPN